jgi:hypothetical protein
MHGVLILQSCMAGGERLALSPTVNVDNTWLSSRANDTPHDILVTIIDLLMLGERPVCTQNSQHPMRLFYQVLKDIRDESEISWTQVLPLVAAFADNCAIAGERKDDGVLLAVVMNC